MRITIAVPVLLALRMAVPPSGASELAVTRATLSSRILDRQVAYLIWIPSAAPSPGLVLFLHGLYDGPERFVEQGALDGFARRIAAGALPPMALALPDAGASFYVDAPNGEAYERFLFDEFLPHLERAHRLDFERPLVVMGLSMGGYGALKLALRRPDRFAAALAFSPMLVPLEELRAAESASEPPWALARLQRVFGTPIDEPLYRANDPLTLAAGAPAQGPALYVAAGEQDRYGFDRGARLFASLLRQRGRACELHLLPTGHGWSLLERDFPAALDFLAGVLAATPSPSAP